MVQFPVVRVPIPVVLLLTLLTVAGVWWHGTRNKDFMTSATEEQLAQIRQETESSIPQSEQPENAVTVPKAPEPPPTPPKPPKPPLEPGDFTKPPSLTEYQDQAAKGADHLIELAIFLETQGQFQRALLAWERVLDFGKPSPKQANTALTAIKRLRPTLPEWNADAKQTVTITLHAGTGRKTAKILKPALEETAKHLETSSSGLLKVKVDVAVGRDLKDQNAPAPVALWITGADKKSRSTDVLSFTVQSPDALKQDVETTTFQIIRDFVGRRNTQCPPPALNEKESALDAFKSHITRHFWQELGSLLNHPAE